MKTIFQCEQQSDIFIDAAACDRNMNLIFLSLYGRDGSIQQFLSRIHLGSRDDGISKLKLIEPASRVPFEFLIGDPRRLDKLTGQLPKGGLFGKLVHAWIFDPVICKPDRPNRSGWLLFDQAHDDLSRRAQVWALIQHLSPIPLMSHWQSRIEALITDQADGRAGIRTAPARGPITPVEVALPTDFEQMVSAEIKAKRLDLAHHLPDETADLIRHAA